MRVRAGPTHGHKRDTCVAVALLVMAGLIGACSAAGPTSNGAGDSVTLPAPVLSVPVIGGTEVTVSWTAPDTNLVVSGYELRWRLDSPSDSPWNSAPVDSTVTTHTISGLDPGTTYRIQVRAVFTPGGPGEWSQAVNPSTDDPTLPPQVQGAPVVTTPTVTTDSVTVSWTAPQTTETISSYELRYRAAAGIWTDVVDIPPTDTSYPITGLNPGTDYQIQVRAVFTSGGPGEWSQAVNVSTDNPDNQTLPPPPPQVERAPVVTTGTVTTDSVTVSWTAPQTTETISRYELRYRAAVTWIDVVDIPSTVTSYVITSLVPGTDYQIQVRAAFASASVSPWSQTLTATTASMMTDESVPTFKITTRRSYIEGDAAISFVVDSDLLATEAIRFSVHATETGVARMGVWTGGVFALQRSVTVTVTMSKGANQQFVTVFLTPVDNMTPDGSSVITATIEAGTGYQLGSPSSVTITVLDND